METSNMPSLRERLWGKTLPLREKLEKAKDLAVATAKEIPGEMAKQVGQPMLRGFAATGAKIAAMGVAMSTPSRTVYDMKQEERPPQVIETAKAEEPEPAPAIRTLEEQFIGTNYDPYDPDQTRPNPDGRGAAGVLMDDNMVATALKEDGITGNLRLGTVIRVPELGNRLFLVADTMSQDFNGMNKIDFVRAEKKKTSDPEVNKKFSNIEIVREGNGRADTRDFVKSGEWAKMLNQQTPQ